MLCVKCEDCEASEEDCKKKKIITFVRFSFQKQTIWYYLHFQENIIIFSSKFRVHLLDLTERKWNKIMQV